MVTKGLSVTVNLNGFGCDPAKVHAEGTASIYGFLMFPATSATAVPAASLS